MNTDDKSPFYTPAQRRLQDDFDTRPLADRLEMAIVTPSLANEQQDFIRACDFFFLATVNSDGQPTVSYKGGGPGFVQITDEATLTFPLYDGNGMFLSGGNISDTGEVGLLFIDFETPQRVRVQGAATLTTDGIADHPGAIALCRVSISHVFVNCARYIHKHTRTENSPYVPDDDGNQPVPSWKRIDLLQDVLPAHDLAGNEAAGGVITAEEYARRLGAGES